MVAETIHEEPGTSTQGAPVFPGPLVWDSNPKLQGVPPLPPPTPPPAKKGGVGHGIASVRAQREGAPRVALCAATRIWYSKHTWATASAVACGSQGILWKSLVVAAAVGAWSPPSQEGFGVVIDQCRYAQPPVPADPAPSAVSHIESRH